MANIKSFQEGWNNKHKDYLEAKKKAFEAIDLDPSQDKTLMQCVLGKPFDNNEEE